MSLNRGSKLGPCEILAPIGTGGMGEIYKPRDTGPDRTKAIRIANQSSDRFQRRASANVALNHLHSGNMYDVGSDYLVKEAAQGPIGARRREGNRTECGTLAAD